MIKRFIKKVYWHVWLKYKLFEELQRVGRKLTEEKLTKFLEIYWSKRLDDLLKEYFQHEEENKNRKAIAGGQKK